MSAENDIFLYGHVRQLPKFKVVGFLPSVQYQRCRYLVQRLHLSYPKEFGEPEIKGMLNVEWDEYLTKMKRKEGQKYYSINGLVAVYFKDELLGDDTALIEFVKQKYNLEITLDFEEIAEKDIIRYFSEIIEKYKRKFVYLTIAIGERVIGSLLFMLYNDLVPITCDNFWNRCVDYTPNFSYKNTRIHRLHKKIQQNSSLRFRIARYSWIQCGGYDLEEIPMACENYIIPHDRRGVLSMCNKRRHTQNSTQFYITLGPACWMDYRYVAFGQLIQGAEILNIIEKVPTFYESPVRKITIVGCGEFSLCPTPSKEYSTALNPPYEELFEEVKDDDIDSILSEAAFKAGKYSLRTDLKQYLPFLRYSQMFDSYMQNITGQETEEEEQVEEEEEKEEKVEEEEDKNTLFKPSPNFYHKFLTIGAVDTYF